MGASKLRATVNCDMGEVSVDFRVSSGDETRASWYVEGKYLNTSKKDGGGQRSRGCQWKRLHTFRIVRPFYSVHSYFTHHLYMRCS